jgi:hypothetical protein
MPARDICGRAVVSGCPRAPALEPIVCKEGNVALDAARIVGERQGGSALGGLARGEQENRAEREAIWTRP